MDIDNRPRDLVEQGFVLLSDGIALNIKKIVAKIREKSDRIRAK